MSAKKPAKPKRPAKPGLTGVQTQVLARLAGLYADMSTAYGQASTRLGLSCADCPDNCCVSFFQHHTRVEWLYLWQGLAALPGERRAGYLGRAEDWVRQARQITAQGLRPRLLCPLNDGGLCGVYEHRLMICRLHGVPNVLRRPDGREISFPGCFKAQELTGTGEAAEAPAGVVLDRTPFYTALARLEMDLLGPRARQLPRVDLTLAEMLVLGAPEL